MSQGRPDEAALALDEGVSANPGNYALLSSLGMLLVMRRLDDRAEEVLKRALAVVDFDPDAWTTLGGIEMRKGDHTKALECFDRAVSLDAAFTPAHMNIGAARMSRYFGQGRDPADWLRPSRAPPGRRPRPGAAAGGGIRCGLDGLECRRGHRRLGKR
jgi:tetratricopeptide (TPR) repeat protein